METAVSTLSILPSTREQQHNFANKMIEELLNGEYDILKVWQQMSIIADTLNEIKESNTLKQAVLSELSKYGKEGMKLNGCTLTIGSRRNFDFSQCKFEKYDTLKASIKEATTRQKEYEIMLKSLSMPVADPDTGEMINPPAYTTTEYVIVK